MLESTQNGCAPVRYGYLAARVMAARRRHNRPAVNQRASGGAMLGETLVGGVP